MPQDVRLNRLAEAIKVIAAERFAGSEIVSVHVDEDTDYDGDPIFVVTLIIDSNERALDPKKTSSLTRHVRSKLAEMHETGFPLVSFISKADAEGLAG